MLSSGKATATPSQGSLKKAEVLLSIISLFIVIIIIKQVVVRTMVTMMTQMKTTIGKMR